jgi:hypothetical protein
VVVKRDYVSVMACGKARLRQAGHSAVQGRD